MSATPDEITAVSPATRLELLNCPGCDRTTELKTLELHEETVCPHCGVTLLLVRIDGVLMFLRDGWT